MTTKNHLKRFLDRLSLWDPLNLVKSIPAILRWIKSGCVGPAPHVVKMRIIKAYLKRHEVSQFIETGTYLGDTLAFIAKTGIPCTSIELSQQLYEAACTNFKDYINVQLIQGDSGEKLPALLEKISTPVLFWLDGHFSAGITAKSGVHTPVSDELAAILAHAVADHVILIDDARCFDGTDDYPQLDELLMVVRQNGRYSAEVSTDVIRLVPCSNS